MREFCTWLRALFSSWVKLMTTSVGLVLSLWGWLAIPDPGKFRAWVIFAGVAALFSSCYYSWREQSRSALQERARNAFPKCDWKLTEFVMLR